MQYVAMILGGSLPMGLLIFVGSYFGIWRKNTVKLPWGDVFGIFIGAWMLAAVLLIAFQVMLSGQDQEIRQVVGTLWGPLIVGVLIGRKFTSWRREKIKMAESQSKLSPDSGIGQTKPD